MITPVSLPEGPFIPDTPISFFPQDEHGDVFPTKKVRSFDYEKEAKKIYRPSSLPSKLKRKLFRFFGLLVGEPVVYFRYLLTIKG